MKLLIFIAIFIAAESARAEHVRVRPQQTKISSIFQAIMLRKPLPKAEDPRCTEDGIMCYKCTTLIMCTSIGDNEWQEDVLETCAAGNSCTSGFCSDSFDPDCEVGKEEEFVCNGQGMFPNPLNCQYYHTCCDVGKVSKPTKCLGNYYYDPVSTYCKTAMPASGCPANTQINCPKAGIRLPHPLNKSIYYICVSSKLNPGKFYPKLYLCANGKAFDSVEGKCK